MTEEEFQKAWQESRSIRRQRAYARLWQEIQGKRVDFAGSYGLAREWEMYALINAGGEGINTSEARPNCDLGPELRRAANC